MTEQITQIVAMRRGPGGWSLGAAVIAALVLLPILTVVWLALNPSQDIWHHLISTTLPRYLSNSVILMTAVGALSAVVGTVTAWLVTMYRFPGVRWLEWALLMPLAIPAYVGAYALVDFLEYAGPVQTGLRQVFGWHSARDYAFPEIRSRWAAVLVISAALYPYVYLLARAAFRELSAQSFDVARALGAGHVARFWRVGLPLARPAIAAGTAVVMMETVNDFGVVEYFGVQTLTTGIFTVWLEQGNAGGAAQIACVILTLVFVLVMLEKLSRRRSRFYALSRSESRPGRTLIRGGWGWLAFVLCTIPFAAGFVLPVAVLSGHAVGAADRWADPDLARATLHTLVTGGAAAVLTVGGALFLVYGVRLSGRVLPRFLMPATLVGYAAPGAVLGLGLLLPLAWFDNRVADLWLAITGTDPGLILTGSAAAIVLAYTVRFFAIAQGATDAAMGRVSPSLPMAARALGRTAGGALSAIYLPMMRGSLATALLLVFVDCVKELPATLLLRPFNYNTLATRVYEQASLERIGDAAPAALLVTFVGLTAVAILARANR
ncbi:ABC transporter permease [Palleronia abyssalis]|uniref:2-aminoethylphosphonate transport system permease protein PhnU n=1 Tax=Palleronia abyssalis TaxID=1501240 RepID=A0A2R8BUN4_9RHOB|nr:iron ABC transporter permease [Palleronia abyssalis]SPJ23862.1 Putative 2-aminoethylphosphonate transport system permease protein PhnU [Palleronia abyssalis]